MANSKQEWFDRLKSWVPNWMFFNERINVALFQAIARVIADRETDVESLLDQTLIGKSTDALLDLHGLERSAVRLDGESDASFRFRVVTKSIRSACDYSSLIKIIRGHLITGSCVIREDSAENAIFSGSSFVDRGEMVLEPIVNAFTIVVDRQLHEPYSFLVEDTFTDNLSFSGQNESSSSVFDRIMKSVNENKAFGVVYRIIERIN